VPERIGLVPAGDLTLFLGIAVGCWMAVACWMAALVLFRRRDLAA
jgi:hypothetical protein